MKKIMLIIMDGLGDRPNDNLGGKTPLEAAYIPNMNRITSNGIGGMMFSVDQGVVCGSDTSHLSILGYDPVKYYTGRGPFEAMGLGIEVRKSDVSFRANFATRDENNIIIDRRAGRLDEDATELCKALSVEIDGIEFIVKNGVEHRAALVMRGNGLSDKISDSDPHSVGKAPNSIFPTSPEGKLTADVLNKYLARSREILKNHPFNMQRISAGKLPANEILLRGAGITPKIDPFLDVYEMPGAYAVGIPMIKGLANLVGLEEIKVQGITGSTDTNYKGKIKAAIEGLLKKDFVLVNIKAPDVAAHDKNPILKRNVIEMIDEAMEPLVDILEETVIVMTGDHSTSSESGEHTGDPVPIAISSYGIRTNGCARFDEKNCGISSFRIYSRNVMQYAMQLADRAEKYGA